MAFVNELISENDKQKFDWNKFKAWPFSKPHRPWKWMVDHERDVFLIPLAQSGYDDINTRSDLFVLYWKKEVIRVEARVIESGKGKSLDKSIWKASIIDIPIHLQKERNEIIKTLKEAFCAHGWLFDIDHVKTVHMRFM